MAAITLPHPCMGSTQVYLPQTPATCLPTAPPSCHLTYGYLPLPRSGTATTTLPPALLPYTALPTGPGFSIRFLPTTFLLPFCLHRLPLQFWPTEVLAYHHLPAWDHHHYAATTCHCHPTTCIHRTCHAYLPLHIPPPVTCHHHHTTCRILSLLYILPAATTTTYLPPPAYYSTTWEPHTPLYIYFYHYTCFFTLPWTHLPACLFSCSLGLLGRVLLGSGHSRLDSAEPLPACTTVHQDFLALPLFLPAAILC